MRCISGLTEAGMGTKGIIATALAEGMLLQEGIGDTIRASLTPEPGGDRTIEVKVCQEILQALGLTFLRAGSFRLPGMRPYDQHGFPGTGAGHPALSRQADAVWAAEYPGVETMKVAVMGCIVNGPGESKHADIGVSLPGTGEQPVAPVFIDGKKAHTLRGENIAKDFEDIVERYVAERFGKSKAA
jgi:(E)-4-hydroxy-3-methylbut-2-enyl-diphosphate synthase